MVTTPAFPLLGVTVALLVLMIPLSAYVAHGERHGIDWRGAGRLSIGRAAGAFGGLWVLVAIWSTGLGLLIGWTTVLAVAVAVVAPALHPNWSSVRWSPWASSPSADSSICAPSS